MMAAMASTSRLGGTAQAEDARKIAGNSELREIAARGAGFIIDPFNRRWHVAACPRVAVMTAREPKWHAGTVAALEAFLEQRLARYATAQPVLPCPACGENASALQAPPDMSSRLASTTAGPQPRDPCVRRSDSGFEVWADEYVRNESAATSAAGLLRRLIAAEVRSLPAPAGHILHAGYGGWRRPGTDAENLLYNNVDQSLSLFGRPGALGIRFEDLGLTAPPAPCDATRLGYYCYRLAQSGTPFTAVQPGRLICRVPQAVVPDGPARLAARIWLAVRRARPLPEAGVPAEHGSFLLRITVGQLAPAASIKAIVERTLPWEHGHDPGLRPGRACSHSTATPRSASHPTTTAALRQK
jgi:hypothetical protein